MCEKVLPGNLLEEGDLTIICVFSEIEKYSTFLYYCDQLRRYSYFPVCPLRPPPKKNLYFMQKKKILLSPRPKENRMLISIIEIAVLTFFAVRGIIMIAYVPPIRMSTNPVLTKVQNGFCK